MWNAIVRFTENPFSLLRVREASPERKKRREETLFDSNWPSENLSFEIGGRTSFNADVGTVSILDIGFPDTGSPMPSSSSFMSSSIYGASNGSLYPSSPCATISSSSFSPAPEKPGSQSASAHYKFESSSMQSAVVIDPVLNASTSAFAADDDVCMNPESRFMSDEEGADDEGADMVYVDPLVGKRAPTPGSAAACSQFALRAPLVNPIDRFTQSASLSSAFSAKSSSLPSLGGVDTYTSPAVTARMADITLSEDIIMPSDPYTSAPASVVGNMGLAEPGLFSSPPSPPPQELLARPLPQNPVTTGAARKRTASVMFGSASSSSLPAASTMPVMPPPPPPPPATSTSTSPTHSHSISPPSSQSASTSSSRSSGRRPRSRRPSRKKASEKQPFAPIPTKGFIPPTPLRRKQTSRACTNCVKAKAGCDQNRPCSRCVRLGKATCVDRALQHPPSAATSSASSLVAQAHLSDSSSGDELTLDDSVVPRKPGFVIDLVDSMKLTDSAETRSARFSAFFMAYWQALTSNLAPNMLMSARSAKDTQMCDAELVAAVGALTSQQLSTLASLFVTSSESSAEAISREAAIMRSPVGSHAAFGLSRVNGVLARGRPPASLNAGAQVWDNVGEVAMSLHPGNTKKDTSAYTKINDVALQVLGCSRANVMESLLGRFHRLVHPSDWNTVMKRIVLTITGKLSECNDVVHLVRPSGDVVKCLASFRIQRPPQNADGSTDGHTPTELSLRLIPISG